MRLYKAAITLIIIICIGFIKSIYLDFFVPDRFTLSQYDIYLFTNLISACINHIFWIIFYYAFRKEFLSMNYSKIKRIVKLLIFTHFVIVVFAILNFSSNLGFVYVWRRELFQITLLIYWFLTLFHYVLYLKIHSEKVQEQYPTLKSPLFLMIIGTFIVIMQQTWTIITFYYSQFTHTQVQLFSELIEKYIYLAIDSFPFVITFYFLYSIYTRFKPVTSK